MMSQVSTTIQVDSLKQIIKTAKSDTTVLNALLEWDGLIYMEDAAMDLVLNHRIDSLCIKNLYSKLEKKERNKFIKSRAFALNNLGIIYDGKGDYAMAIDFYTHSLTMYEEINEKRGIAISLNNIGAIYHDQGNLKNAIDYYTKSLKIKEEIGDQSGIALSLSNIGNVYQSQNDLDNAILFYDKSLKIREETGNKNGIASTLNNIGIIYQKKGELVNAKDYFSKSLQLYEEVNDLRGTAVSLNNIGNIYKNQGNLIQALSFNEKSLKIAIEISAATEIKQAAESLWEVNKKLGNFKQSLVMYELFVSTRDSLESEENQKEIMRQEFKYHYDKQAATDSIINAEMEKVQLAELEAEKALSEKQKTQISSQKTQSTYLYVGLGLIALFSVFMYNRFKVTKKQKLIIEEQKQEVEKQKGTVEKTLQELETTYVKLESTHEQITDSIRYAERIQRSFLASKSTLDEFLKEYFVFFQPKEAVSGDFYWAAQLPNSHFAFAVADSTGHGVPGAIMSLLNITSLEKSIETETEPHIILNKTRQIIINRLKEDGSEHGGKDGMDCCLMVFNKAKTVLTFASANNSLIIIRDKKIIEFKGDKMPVGKHDNDTETFTLQNINLMKGDVIYALTDGFADQFGGPNGRKYMIKNLKKMFLKIAELPMDEQKAKLSLEFANWKGKNDQVDDMCIVGVRV